MLCVSLEKYGTSASGMTTSGTVQRGIGISPHSYIQGETETLTLPELGDAEAVEAFERRSREVIVGLVGWSSADEREDGESVRAGLLRVASHDLVADKVGEVLLALQVEVPLGCGERLCELPVGSNGRVDERSVALVCSGVLCVKVLANEVVLIVGSEKGPCMLQDSQREFG